MKFILDFFDRWLYNLKTYTINFKGDAKNEEEQKSIASFDSRSCGRYSALSMWI
ncbi:hypothetical protein D3C73_1448890 [compost metagenome]